MRPQAAAPGPGPASPADWLLLTVLTIVTGGAAVVWAGVQVAALVAGGGPAPVGLADAASALPKLPAHLGDPAAAFSPEIAAVLPAGWVVWACIIAVAVGVATAAVVVADRLAGRHRREEVPPAAWATRRDLRALHVSGPQPGRLTLGTHDGRLVAAEAAQAVIVLGPARSGKTTGLAIPAIAEWDGPVIATSVRTDLVAATAHTRTGRGRVWVYDPTGDTDATTARWRAGWDPLDGCRTWAGAQATATWLCATGRAGSDGDRDEFWYAVAAKLLAPLLYAASFGGYTMADVVAWVDTQEQAAVRAELEVAGTRAAIDAATASFAREARALSSAYTTAEVVLRAFADPNVLDSTLRGDIGADRLLDGGAHTLYICAPASEQDRLTPVFSALLQQLVTAVYRRHATTGRPLDRPLLIVLDEAANIAPLRNLDTLASTAAGTGIQLLTVWQDLAQIQARYGQRAATVVNNHRGKIVLSGVSDPPTFQYVSALCGDTEIDTEQVSRDSTGRRSTSTGPAVRPLAAADRLRQQRPYHGVLIYGHLPPAQLQLRPPGGDRRRGLRAATVTEPQPTVVGQAVGR